jgi:DNA modification methylase
MDPEAYLNFLRSKAVIAQERGYAGSLQFTADLKPHARDIARWMIRGGNRACFASFGLHKTSIELQVIESILEKFPGSGLVVCPLGVKHEFVNEARERGFNFEPVYVRTNEEHDALLAEGHRYFLTNYERVRDGALDPNRFQVVSLDEAAVLRSFGSKTYQTFLTLFDKVPFKFVATATPSPNRFKELIHYAGFLGIMETGQALTRFFKRDSTQAGNLKVHPHKEKEFLLWLGTWATFLTKPSDIGYSDEGYDLPPVNIVTHRLPVDHSTAGFDSWGQGKLIRDASVSVSSAARERRESLTARVEKVKEIIREGGPGRKWIIWHELEDERRALQEAIPEISCIWGSQDIEVREHTVEEFQQGHIELFGSKPSLSGYGSNFQKWCYSNIFFGLNYKFADFIQAIHRTLRFGQTHEVEAHLIYTESEDRIYEALMDKWEQDRQLRGKMEKLIIENGLNNAKAGAEMYRSIGVTRQEVKGERFTVVNNDCVMEMPKLADNSVHLIVTSWPFSDHYEYTESYNDLGHNDGDTGFFEQMEFLTPEIMRALKPGRLYCVHAKDRIVYGSVSGDGMYTVNPFSDKCVAHLRKHGFRYCGRITVVTDVVRENNQTYRLGWTENSKDGTKMGVGSPEYVLLFRKLPSDLSSAFADERVVKSKEVYTRARWQFDAHSLWRSNGDRFLTPEEVMDMPMDQLRKLWHNYSRRKVYDFKEHVSIAEEMEKRGILPASFMALDPPNPHSPWVWDDVARMKTLNTDQGRKGWEQHVCPLQIDIVERLIERYSNPGDLVLDPFAGLGTVPYVAVQMGRRGYGIELNEQYWRDSISYCRSAEQKVLSPTLFDMTEWEKPSEEQSA